MKILTPVAARDIETGDEFRDPTNPVPGGAANWTALENAEIIEGEVSIRVQYGDGGISFRRFPISDLPLRGIYREPDATLMDALGDWALDFLSAHRTDHNTMETSADSARLTYALYAAALAFEAAR